MEEIISHPAIVNKITDQGIEVSILVQNSCDSCHAKSVCQLSDQNEKVMMIENSSAHCIPGERVEIEMKESHGLQAVLIAYVLPVVLIFLAMLPGIFLQIEEGWLAVSGIGAVVLYFLMVYLFRSRLKKRFSFRIKKI
ncbi:MAG: SoxR reducing system RseC family protein [Bacteroidales bacterium]|nr:SoxR reducing system RseC family protein [Bacteroidales bacterium]